MCLHRLLPGCAKFSAAQFMSGVHLRTSAKQPKRCTSREIKSFRLGRLSSSSSDGLVAQIELRHSVAWLPVGPRGCSGGARLWAAEELAGREGGRRPSSGWRRRSGTTRTTRRDSSRSWSSAALISGGLRIEWRPRPLRTRTFAARACRPVHVWLMNPCAWVGALLSRVKHVLFQGDTFSLVRALNNFTILVKHHDHADAQTYGQPALFL